MNDTDSKTKKTQFTMFGEVELSIGERYIYRERERETELWIR